jgi:hypothetical protein
MEPEKTPRERAEELMSLLVPDWRPTAQQVLWAIRIGIVLSLLVAIGYFYGITLWDWLKVLVFPAAVAIATFGLNQAAKRRDEVRAIADAENEYRRDLLLRLVHAYNDTKKIRPILKAHIVTKRDDGCNVEEISCTVYEEQLEKLNDPQLEVELYKPDREGKANLALLPFENAQSIAERLGEVERFLNRIIHEYDGGHYQRQKQQLFPTGTNDYSRIHLAKLPKLKEFIGTATFLTRYGFTVKDIRKEMQREIKRGY